MAPDKISDNCKTVRIFYDLLLSLSGKPSCRTRQGMGMGLHLIFMNEAHNSNAVKSQFLLNMLLLTLFTNIKFCR